MASWRWERSLFNYEIRSGRFCRGVAEGDFTPWNPIHNLRAGRISNYCSLIFQASLAGDIDYGELAERVQAGLKASDGKQKGDPMKGAKVMVDIVKWEGVAEGRVTPRRMPLGAACWETVREGEV